MTKKGSIKSLLSKFAKLSHLFSTNRYKKYKYARLSVPLIFSIEPYNGFITNRFVKTVGDWGSNLGSLVFLLIIDMLCEIGTFYYVIDLNMIVILTAAGAYTILV